MSPVDVVWKLLGTIVGVFLDLLTFLQLTSEHLRLIHELTERRFLTSDLNTFREFPVVRLDEEQAAVIDLQFLVELLTLGVYYSIFNGLPTECREGFRQMWGRLLELYVVDLLRYFYPPASQILSADVAYEGGQVDALL